MKPTAYTLDDHTLLHMLMRIEGEAFTIRYLKWRDAERDLNFRNTFSDNDIEAAVCSQFKNGEFEMAELVRAGTQRMETRRYIAGLLIHFMLYARQASGEYIKSRYNFSHDFYHRTFDWMADRLLKNRKLNGAYQGCCNSLIEIASNRLINKFQLAYTDGDQSAAGVIRPASQGTFEEGESDRRTGEDNDPGIGEL